MSDGDARRRGRADVLLARERPENRRNLPLSGLARGNPLRRFLREGAVRLPFPASLLPSRCAERVEYYRGAVEQAGSWSALEADFGRRLTVLVYHRVDSDDEVRRNGSTISLINFERQIRSLARSGYTGIAPSQWLAWLRDGRPLPPKPILLTFDDGYAQTAEIALPVLKSYGFSACLFVVTGELGGTNSWDQDKGIASEPLITADRIRYWAAQGFEFGSHTRHHADLTKIGGADLQNEIDGSARDLADVLGAAPDCFAYSYGLHNPAVRDCVRRRYALAFTVEGGVNALDADPLAMKRAGVKPGLPGPDYWLRVRFGFNPLSRLAALARPALLVLLAAGCGRAPVEFPVGFFGVNAPADARALAEGGFDAVQSYASDAADVKALARATRENGQLLLVGPDGAMSSGARGGDFPGAVWYLADEPDVHHASPDALAERDRAVKTWAPGAKTAFVVGDGRHAADYPGTADAIMVDWYPVPHLPLESAGDMVKLTSAAAGGRKVWAVLQAMDWRDFPQHDPSKRRVGRFPTAAEIRFMSYDAVLNGAQGVWYFTYSTSTTSRLSDSPERLAAVAGPASELRALAPVFARGREIPLPFARDLDGPAARAWTYRGRDYVILAARRSGADVRWPVELLSPQWRPLFEARRDPRELLRPYAGAWYLRSHQVLVLESRLSLKRLIGR